MPLVEQFAFLKPEPTTEDCHLHNNLGYDSLDHICLISEVEKEFNLSIPDEEMEKFRTARDVIDWVYKEINK